MVQDELCPSGSEITTAEECRDALGFAAALGITLEARNHLVSGSWDYVPGGCSYQAIGDQAFHFNQNNGNAGLHQYNMICKQGKTVNIFNLCNKYIYRYTERLLVHKSSLNHFRLSGLVRRG